METQAEGITRHRVRKGLARLSARNGGRAKETHSVSEDGMGPGKPKRYALGGLTH